MYVNVCMYDIYLNQPHTLKSNVRVIQTSLILCLIWITLLRSCSSSYECHLIPIRKYLKWIFKSDLWWLVLKIYIFTTAEPKVDKKTAHLPITFLSCSYLPVKLNPNWKGVCTFKYEIEINKNWVSQWA